MTGERPSTPQFATHLNESDALLWSIERDPHLRTTIVAISILDESPDWQHLHSRMEGACHIVPRLRQKVMEAPLRVGRPRWQFDEDFDIDYHLRRVVAPAPGDLQAVLDLAAPIAMAAFDRDRPLWEFTLVEGLEDGQAALIQKVHHAFTDGVGGIKLAQLLLDDRRHPAVVPEPGDSGDEHPVSQMTSALESMSADIRTAARFTVRGAKAVPGLAAALLSRPTDVVGSGIRGVQSIGKLLAPVTRPMSPVMTARSLSRRLGAFDVPFEAMHAAAHAADSTVNDAFLASVTGGLRRYHVLHGKPTHELRVTMPINLRRSDDGLGNNRFVPARLPIPIDEPDPSERMRQLGVLAKSWRKEPALPLTEVIAGALNRLPVQATTSIFGSMLKAIDFVATNVPGIPQRAYLAGAEVLREYAFAPPSGAALSIALLSHRDRCCVGVNIDTAAVPDPDQMMSCLRDGFDEVLAVGEAATPPPVRTTARATRKAVRS